MGRGGSFKIKQCLTVFIGSAGDIILITEPGGLDSSQTFSNGNFWDCLSGG